MPHLESRIPAPSYRSLTRFFLPLAFQSISQSTTYPLVAMVASHGPGGAVNYAGLIQSNTVMAILSMLGVGLITTGMVFVKSKKSYDNFCSLNRDIMIAVFFIQLICCIPPISHFIFSRLIGLPPT